MGNNLITIKKTKHDYDFIATVTNKSENPVLITFKNDDLPSIRIAPHLWFGILADDEGRAMLKALERKEYSIILLDPLYLSLIKTAENYGWSVEENDDGGIDFLKESPAGEDFGFYIHPTDDIAEAVNCFYLNFDEDEHVEMWVEAKHNRSTNGIPSVRELVEDAAAINEMLKELSDAFIAVRDTGEIQCPPKVVAEENNAASTKVVVVIEGGMVAEVYSDNSNIDLVIIDRDVPDCEEIEQDEGLDSLAKIYPTEV